MAQCSGRCCLAAVYLTISSYCCFNLMGLATDLPTLPRNQIVVGQFIACYRLELKCQFKSQKVEKGEPPWLFAYYILSVQERRTPSIMAATSDKESPQLEIDAGGLSLHSKVNHGTPPNPLCVSFSHQIAILCSGIGSILNTGWRRIS